MIWMTWDDLTRPKSVNCESTTNVNFVCGTIWSLYCLNVPINHWKRTVCGVTFYYFLFITSKIKKIGSIFSPKHIFQVPHEHYSTFLRCFTINYSIPLQYPFVHKKLNALEHLHAHSQKSKYTTPTKKKLEPRIEASMKRCCVMVYDTFLQPFQCMFGISYTPH